MRLFRQKIQARGAYAQKKTRVGGHSRHQQARDLYNAAAEGTAETAG